MIFQTKDLLQTDVSNARPISLYYCSNHVIGNGMLIVGSVTPSGFRTLRSASTIAGATLWLTHQAGLFRSVHLW
jgi:hypothetical protein